MEINVEKKRVLPQKPEWKILLDNFVYQDETMIYRICRKMIIHLDRIGTPEIYKLIEGLRPSHETDNQLQTFGDNLPKPRGVPFIPSNIVGKLFEIADHYLDDSDITALLTRWIQQEHLSYFTEILDQRWSPFEKVCEAIKKLIGFNRNEILSMNERIGLRVSIITRLFSENLRYIGIAKDFISIESVGEIMNRIAGVPNGVGGLGGKSAGLLLAYNIIKNKNKEYPILENIKIPRSWYLTVDGLFEFVHYNALEEFVFKKYQTNQDIKQEYPFLQYIFKTSPFPPESVRIFQTILNEIDDNPIVVRSSSILEDSFDASFCGKYKSLFISNLGSYEERLAALTNAVAEVYASTYGPDPIEYRKEHGLVDFREEMGLLIQEVVGTRIGKYYLPLFAGVGFSNNDFAWTHRIKREDGLIRLVAGLGTRSVDRTMNDYPKLISPGQPGLQVNNRIEETLLYSQHYVDVINLETSSFETIKFSELIKSCGGYFDGLEKIVSFFKTGTFHNPISKYDDFEKEKLVITFNNLIDRTDFINQIKTMLNVLRDAIKVPVDIEFASNGLNTYLLQCRPQSQRTGYGKISIPKNIPSELKVFETNLHVSSGIVNNIKFMVNVNSQAYSKLATAEDMHTVSDLIGMLNRLLPRKEFILIGPGRWGSKGDIKLGVPVLYSDINNTAMLIEVAKESAGYMPELSFGTHFFQDLVEADIKYLPLYPEKKGCLFHDDLFKTYPNKLTELIPDSSRFESVIQVIHIQDIFNNGTVSVYMDGESSHGLAYFVIL
ncbi:MAG: pyruvate, phosphate dikinase [Candidatus Kapabacteria bacterium]|nr:pyruvate, phosphate dikinase [Candidatus Kapabacteria bacterium]